MAAKRVRFGLSGSSEMLCLPRRASLKKAARHPGAAGEWRQNLFWSDEVRG